MVRLEIVGNLSLEQDLLDAFEDAGLNFYYTKLSGVKGKGDQGQKQMDSVWPEENFLIFTYIDEIHAKKIINIVYDIKCAFPKEGINVFQVNSLESVEPQRVLKAQEKASLSVSQQAMELEKRLQGTKTSSSSKTKKPKSDEETSGEAFVAENPLL